MSNKNLEELENLSKPLIEWLIKNYNPHTEIRINFNGAEVLEGQLGILKGKI